MKKMFVIAVVSFALAACGGKGKKDDAMMKNTGGDMTNTTPTEEGGATYGGDTYGNPCGGANPCNPTP
jgi:hypothetical protein